MKNKSFLVFIFFIYMMLNFSFAEEHVHIGAQKNLKDWSYAGWWVTEEGHYVMCNCGEKMTKLGNDAKVGIAPHYEVNNSGKCEACGYPMKKNDTSSDGDSHEAKPPVDNGGAATVNRRHICSVDGYLPNPNDPEKGHIKRCYYPECEYYSKGIQGSESKHSYKYNEDKKVNICIVCYYEEGSNITEPQKVYSRDFGIDVLQSQYFIVKDITTEVELILTGIEKDVDIEYGPVGGKLKSSGGRKDENSVYLKWDIKDDYARKVLNIGFKRQDDDRILTIDLKEGYEQPSRTEVDLILENKFGEKRIETIELIKEAPERAQFILRFSSKNMINSIAVGETKEVYVYCKSQYGYGNADRKEVQDYYSSKNLINYENIQIKWEGKGGITATGETTPNEEGYVKGQITGVSVTDGEPAELIITATAKYENGDLIDEVERELKKGLYVYDKNSNSVFSGSNSISNGSDPVNSKTPGKNSPKGTHTSSKGVALPIAAVSVGLLAIGCVIFAVNKITKR